MMIEESFDDEEEAVGDWGTGTFAGSTSSDLWDPGESGRGGSDGSGCGYMRPKLVKLGRSEVSGLFWAERGALFVTGNSEGGGEILRILFDWRKARLDVDSGWESVDR
jgi:hypothetical protein